MDKKNFETISKIYDKLCDQESKNTFHARLNFIINRDEEEFLEWILNQDKNFYCPELDEYEKNMGNCEYILFGAGYEGRKTKRILERCCKRVVAWSDNNINIWGKEIDGLPVLIPGNLKNSYLDKTIIITVRNSELAIYRQLLKLGFPRERIIILRNGFVIAYCGKQYFDVFSGEQGEIFVDAGCWNGETSKEFINWCGGEDKYNKIYAFEPEENCWSQCEETFKEAGINKIEFIKKGTWKEQSILGFHGNGDGGSTISQNKEMVRKVPVISIDEVLGEDRCTFIKMDVEGSEMETLIGAREHIKKHKPKMAVCVYHKPEDLWRLADYILSLEPSYKLYLRHYSTCNYETVLYAI